MIEVQCSVWCSNFNKRGNCDLRHQEAEPGLSCTLCNYIMYGRSRAHVDGVIKRSELTSRTRSNLDKLEGLAFGFGDYAFVEYVDQGKSKVRSFFIPGCDFFSHEEVLYVRRETSHRSSGQTKLYWRGSRHGEKVTGILEEARWKA